MLNSTYQAIVKLAKTTARDILRMKKLNKWMRRETANAKAMEAEVKRYEEAVKAVTVEIETTEFEANNTPNDHPKKEQIMEKAEKAREIADKKLEAYKEDHEVTVENIKTEGEHIQKAITEWTLGKRLVSSAELNTLSESLIEDYVRKNFEDTPVEEEALPVEEETEDTA